MILLSIVTLVPLLTSSLGVQECSVEGVVLNHVSGQSIPDVHVRLFLGINIQPATQAYGANTDAAGRFSIASIPPGYYTVDLERTGFLQGVGKNLMRGSAIELRPGQHLTGWKLEMAPLVMIAGRVINQYGDPVPNVQIQPSEEALSSGSDTWYGGYYNIKHTDERGGFRLFTPPGKYYLVAIPFRDVSSRPEEIRTDGTPVLVYDRTYYPASPDAGSATMVEAEPGKDITDVVIRMCSTSPKIELVLSGVITGIPPGAQATIAHQYSISPGRVLTGGRSNVGADGKFSIDHLKAGYVRLLARCVSGDTVLQSDPVEIRLEPPGATDVKLPLIHQTNGTIAGNVQIVDDDPATAFTGRLVIALSASDDRWSFVDPMLGRTEVGPNGAFRTVGIPPGRYRLSIFNMPDNSYVKSTLFDDLAVDESILDFSRGAPDQPMRIIISRNGAQIVGEVRDTDEGPALNPNIMVFLAPESNQISRFRGAAVNGGRYLLKGIPPGRYKIYAADVTKRAAGIRATWPGGDPDLAFAETVDVPEGGHVTKNLKVVAREEPDAHPKH